MGLRQVQEGGEQGLEEEQGYWEALNFQVQHSEKQGLKASVPWWPSMEYV